MGAGGGDLFLCLGSRLRGSSLRLGSSFFFGSGANCGVLLVTVTFLLAEMGSMGISTRGSSCVGTESSGESGASWILSSGSGEAGPEAGEAGVVGRLLEDGDWYPGEEV